MITYRLNWMGPVNKKWIEKYGIDWSCGRVDIYGLDETEYFDGKHEYAAHPMRRLSWGMFGHWLSKRKDTELVPLQDLVADFEAETGHEIEWLEVPGWKKRSD